MLADVAHLDLPGRRVGGRVGQRAPLEQLHQHPLLIATDRRANSVWLGDRMAEGVQPVARSGAHEFPECARDVVLRRLVIGVKRRRRGCQPSILAERWLIIRLRLAQRCADALPAAPLCRGDERRKIAVIRRKAVALSLIHI